MTKTEVVRNILVGKGKKVYASMYVSNKTVSKLKVSVDFEDQTVEQVEEIVKEIKSQLSDVIDVTLETNKHNEQNLMITYPPKQQK